MSSVKESNNLETIRHSLSHVLAAAVFELRPDTKFAIGPAIENGFYYDFDFGNEKISEEDLVQIEKKMNHILKQNLKFEKSELSIKDAIEKEKKAGQLYKTELIEDLSPCAKASEDKGKAKDKVSYYKLGKFEDLCRGPHIEVSSKIAKGSFKLTKLAGAYWRGDEKNKMLTRVYGVAFATKEKLEEYLKMMEEAEKRDHKKIGKELDLFSFHPEAPGSAFWHPKGMAIWNELETFGKSLRKKHGYLEIQTPILAKNNLWKISGHWDHYKDSMFYFDVEKETYCLKPMDCPFNIKIYQTQQRSYRELPIRYTEIGRILRNEKSGELNGLLRVRHLTQDDSHIFLMKNQVAEEIATLLKMTKEYYSVFGIEPEFFLSTRPENFTGEIKDWDEAEKDLENALKKEKVNYLIKEQDGAFYGPKIDIDIKDALGRRWQMATIQLDFQLPQKFNLEYVDSDGRKKMPVMIHAAIFGSFERFIGIFIEHSGGTFPVWLSPVQIKIISVGEKHIEYCNKLAEEFRENDIRVEVDDRNETVGNKIRKAAGEKIPYVLVAGDKEIESGKLAVRDRGAREAREIGKKEFIKEIGEMVASKK
jgi:threonyl-tRNA synthetase